MILEEQIQQLNSTFCSLESCANLEAELNSMKESICAVERCDVIVETLNNHVGHPLTNLTTENIHLIVEEKIESYNFCSVESCQKLETAAINLESSIAGKCDTALCSKLSRSSICFPLVSKTITGPYRSYTALLNNCTFCFCHF